MTAAQRRFLLAVEAGFCHSKPFVQVNPRARALATRLSLMGMIELLPARGRFPVRWMLTNRGIWAIGTFDSARSIRQERLEQARVAA